MGDEPALVQLTVIESFSIEDFAAAIRDAITGPQHRGAPVVMWRDRGSDLLVHVAKLQVRLLANTIVVAVDTQSAEFQVAPVIVRFVFGGENDAASLVAATDEAALGHPSIASRWGELFRSVVWAALVRLAVTQANRRGMEPSSLLVDEGGLRFAARARGDPR